MTKWLKLLFLVVPSLFLANSAFAQGSFFTGIAWRYTPAGAFPASGATVTICTSGGSGAPCTPTISVFKDPALASPVANPLPICGTPSPQFGCIDGLGNFSFYASTPGPYTYTITGAGLSAYGPIPIYSSLSPSANTTFTGAITVASPGSLTVTGAFSASAPKQIGAEVYASAFPGADCGLKIAAAIAATSFPPGSGLIVDVNAACGTSQWSAVTVSTQNTILQVVEPQIYVTNSITFTSTAPNSGITSKVPCLQGIGGTQNCPVVLKEGPGLNLPSLISFAGTQDFISNVQVDGNKANNPTGGVGILVNKSSRVTISGITVQNAASHGIQFTSTLSGVESGQGAVLDTSSTFNNGDGIFSLNSSDLILRTDILENNGQATPPTVTTTNTSITATAGSWSTDSSLVGTMVRVNNTGMCQVLAIPSTTTITVAAATCWNASGVPTGLGAQAGVKLNWGNGFEGSNAPTIRIEGGGELSANGMDGFLAYGTTTGIGANGSNIAMGNHLANNLNHDIEIIGSCLDTQTSTCSIGHTIYGNTFWIGNLRTVSNTFDKIKLVDGGLNSIIGNYFNFSTGASQEKAAYEQVESAANRVANGNQNRVIANTFNGTPGTSNYVEGTANGSVGMEIPVATGGQPAQFCLFDVTTSAALPRWCMRVSGGNLQFFRNDGTVMAQMINGGQFQQLVGGLQIAGTIGNGTAVMGLTLKTGAASNYTGTNTTYAAVDTTNLCTVITVPTGWKLKVEASGVLESVTAAVAQSVSLADAGATCTSGGVTALNGTERTLTPPAIATFDEQFHTQYVLTGDGSAHSIALMAKTSNAADAWAIQSSSVTLAPSMIYTLMPSN